MTQRTASCVLVSAIIMALGSQLMLNQLDRAAAKQCAEHDWPVSADQLHRDWCIASGYKI